MIKEYVKFIKSIRNERKISQADMAKYIGISRPSYISLEQGKRDLSLDEAQRLVNIFGISLDDIFSGTIPNIKKYKEMILAFLRFKISNDGKITKTKLAKLLYLADFGWFYSHFQSMSGMQYRRIEYGPVPDMYFRALYELEEEGKIVVERKKNEGKEMALIKESDSNKGQKLNDVIGEQLSLMGEIAKKWKDKNTAEIVNFTHNQLPYVICREDELIPYELITQEDPDKVY